MDTHTYAYVKLLLSPRHSRGITYWIYLLNLVFQSGLDLNVESQTWGFLRISAKNCHAPRQARICATHALPSAEHVSK